MEEGVGGKLFACLPRGGGGNHGQFLLPEGPDTAMKLPGASAILQHSELHPDSHRVQAFIALLETPAHPPSARP